MPLRIVGMIPGDCRENLVGIVEVAVLRIRDGKVQSQDLIVRSILQSCDRRCESLLLDQGLAQSVESANGTRILPKDGAKSIDGLILAVQFAQCHSEGKKNLLRARVGFQSGFELVGRLLRIAARQQSDAKVVVTLP